jgi:hypothetical protein
VEAAVTVAELVMVAVTAARIKAIGNRDNEGCQKQRES